MVNALLRKLVSLKVNPVLFNYTLVLKFSYISVLIMLFSLHAECLQESNSLPTPKVDGDDRQRARALATIHSHPVVSLSSPFGFIVILEM